MTDKMKLILISLAVLIFFIFGTYIMCLINDQLRGNMPGIKRSSCFSTKPDSRKAPKLQDETVQRIVQ